MTLSELKTALRAELATALDQPEADAAARIILEDAGGYTPVDIAVNGDRPLEDFTADRLLGLARRVSRKGEPVQYVVGKARFCGMDLKVTPAVLIPRPETEGLVDRITDDMADRRDLDVLDACTGSGCIAIALARALPYAHVDAFDISEEALAVARENAQTMRTHIGFSRADALELVPALMPRYDVIVSNPPYIADSERHAMSDRVLLHEPAIALFVPDTDPLRFYRAIAEYGLRALRPGGRLYFEVNSLYAADTASLLASLGYSDISTDRDFYGRLRYISATLPVS